MLNEYVLFEKYTNVLNKVGEREVNRARQKILSDGLGNITLTRGNASIFITLKLSDKDISRVRSFCSENTDPDTLHLIEMLEKPYGFFFNYNAEWSVSRLEELCNEENLPVPKENEV